MVIGERGEVLAQGRYPFSRSQSPALWRTALFELIGRIPYPLRRSLAGIAIDGTSSTVLACDAQGEPLCSPLLYDDARAVAEAAELATLDPSCKGGPGPTSGLAKILWLSRQPRFSQAAHFLHQADWLGFQLHGRLGVTDYHNALKSGGDPEELDYPDWIKGLPGASLLPRIVAPGSTVGAVSPRIAHHFALPPDCPVRAGTTDSIAAFIASGASRPGEAVTSLGTTLVLKLLSTRRVDSPRHGVYSHRFGRLWLAGGASNSGGGVLRTFFDDARLEELSARIDPERPSGLDYYPLPRPGERFPVADPAYPPRIEPRPQDDAHFLHGLLEGMARIEADGYRLLRELGADAPTRVFSAGGGAHNTVFGAIRSRLLGLPVEIAAHHEAAYGAASLARLGEAALDTRENADGS